MDEDKQQPSVSISLSGAAPAPVKRQEREVELSTPEWFTAQAFVKSGMFKNIGNVYRAFTKIMAGKELGLGPFTAMRALHVLPDGVEMHYTLIGALIRKSGSYEFQIVNVTDTEAVIEFYRVWYDEASKEKKSALAGTSKFTIDDAQKQNLVKPDSAWIKTPRNMLIARAMSNGAKWFCPDVLMMPLYVEGELSHINDVVVEPEDIQLLDESHAAMQRAKWIQGLIATVCGVIMPFQAEAIRESAANYGVDDEALLQMIDRLAQAAGLGADYVKKYKEKMEIP